MKKFMVIFGILAMVWFQSCQTPYNNIDLENEGQNNGTVTEQTNGENQNDNGNNENPSTNEDSNNEENGQDENQQVEHVCKDYFEIEVGEDWTELTYVAILTINDEQMIYGENCFFNIHKNKLYCHDINNDTIILNLTINTDRNRLLVENNNYQIYDVIRNGNIVTVELK